MFVAGTYEHTAKRGRRRHEFLESFSSIYKDSDPLFSFVTVAQAYEPRPYLTKQTAAEIELFELHSH